MGNYASVKKQNKIRKNKIIAEWKKKRQNKIILFLGDKHSGKTTICNQIVNMYFDVNTTKSLESKFTLGSFVINETIYEPLLDHAASTYSHLNMAYNNIRKTKTKQIDFDCKYDDININYNLNYELLALGYIRQNLKEIKVKIPNDIIQLIDKFSAYIPQLTSSMFSFNDWIFEFWNVSVDYQQNWKDLYKYVHALIFVVDTTCYDKYVDVNGKRTNKFAYSLDLFESVSPSHGTSHSNHILFLNKIDLLKEKIQNYTIPNFTNFSMDKNDIIERSFNSADKVDGRSQQETQHVFETTLQEMQEMFITKMNMDGFGHNVLYTHQTYGLDKDYIKKVMWDVENIVLRSNLSVS